MSVMGGLLHFSLRCDIFNTNFGRLGCFVGTSGVDGGTCYINMHVFSGTCDATNDTCAAAEVLASRNTSTEFSVFRGWREK